MRNCIDCPTDISDLHTLAKRCADCAAAAIRATKRSWAARNYKPETRRDRREYMKEYRARTAGAFHWRIPKEQIPAWVDRDALIQRYQFAAFVRTYTGIDLTVDHIVPLSGEGVCGLHVPVNLQILPRLENGLKGNSY